MLVVRFPVMSGQSQWVIFRQLSRKEVIIAREGQLVLLKKERKKERFRQSRKHTIEDENLELAKRFYLSNGVWPLFPKADMYRLKYTSYPT